jgi:CTP:phosphocholine cytidylyltransferase-like protein/thiamine kinase-like enzyme
MAELVTSMINQTVIIPTAGLGSRMGNYTKHLNKALLPYKDKPVLAHIIDNFPKDSKFIIPVGYLKEQIIDFCKVAYNDRNIEFIHVDDWTSDKSGTGYTLLQCKDAISSPFWYVPCDTYFDQTIVDTVRNKDCYFVKTVPEQDTHLYTMFNKNNSFYIQDIKFKEATPATWAAFTGLMYINDYVDFFSRLGQSNSNEFIGIIKLGSDTATLSTWLDFGSPTIYQTELSKSQKFDFTKKDEVTYICNNRVVKWWLDSTVAKKKYDKVLANPHVFPDNCSHSGNYMAYDFFPGKTLYEFNNPVAFGELLNWLETSVWHDCEADIYQASMEFYKTKSLARINKFLEKYPALPSVNNVDGVDVKCYNYYLDKIDWEYFATVTRPGFLHGDLQFDNIVISDSGEFKIIDWRHEFAGIVDFGDIYYDLAKMSGGLIINYANIKNHNFNIEIDNSSVTLSIPNVDHITVYQERLKKYILDNNLDYNKVQQLIPIIFWNMSPLHTAPFDLFLWYLGIKLFQELENA